MNRSASARPNRWSRLLSASETSASVRFEDRSSIIATFYSCTPDVCSCLGIGVGQRTPKNLRTEFPVDSAYELLSSQLTRPELLICGCLVSYQIALDLLFGGNIWGTRNRPEGSWLQRWDRAFSHRLPNEMLVFSTE